MLANIESLIYSSMLFAPPLLIAALGCNLTTSAGIINIGIDGFMTVGAFIGCATTFIFKNPILGLFCAGIASAIASIIFAFFVLKLKTNEFIIGFALNILLPSIVVIIGYALFNSTDTAALPSSLKIPVLFKELSKSEIPFIKLVSPILSNYITSYIAIVLILLSSFLMYKTNIGLYIRACGVNENAANYVGINKYKVRFMCILVSGFLYGISGSIYTMAISNQFRTVSICGQGYIALAAVLFSNGNSLQLLIYSLLFGFFSGLKVFFNSDISTIHLIQMLPYISILIILILKNIRPNKK